MGGRKFVTVRFWAAAKAAAGVGEEVVELSAEATLGDLSDDVRRRHGPDLDRVIGVCSVLVNGSQAGPDPASVLLPADATVEYLPPFAGG
ncbi:MoaD/ThiS family protein [Nocardioides alcanivorans]|uniref:MoaD/ThiS family protein n=1 Tax=Nocardioides alcanivorans TaxID=2897352 RepID=UPI001F3B7D25|nr:MoaD/ThiS family protein [Nocardioides alcanivorans]